MMHMKSCHHSELRSSLSIILNRRIKYTRQMPSLIQVSSAVKAVMWIRLESDPQTDPDPTPDPTLNQKNFNFFFHCFYQNIILIHEQ